MLTHAGYEKVRTLEVNVELPTKWKKAKLYRGQDLTLFGPMNGKLRSMVIAINESQVKGDKWQGLLKDENGYFVVKKDWLLKRSGVFKKELPLRKQKLGSLNDVYSIGSEYVLAGEMYVEKDILLSCKNKFMMMSVLYLKKNESQSKKDFSQITKNFTCR
jgi:hypothetical protein